MKLSKNELKTIEEAELVLRNIFNVINSSQNSHNFLKETEEKLKQKNQIELIENCFALLIVHVSNSNHIIVRKSYKKSEIPFYQLSEAYSALSLYSFHLSMLELIELLKMISIHNSISDSKNTFINGNVKIIETINVI